MDALVEWGYQVILALQAWRSPALDAFFKAISFLGDEEFYLILLPLLYWLVNKRLGSHFALLFLLSSYLNLFLKVLIGEPRPTEARVAVLDDPASRGSLPSGHAQNGLVTWGFLATHHPATAFRVGMALLVLLIGLSRLYLGVHFPHDVVVGWGIGALLLAGWFTLAPRVGAALAARGIAWEIGAGVVVALLFLALAPDEEGLRTAATLLGVAIGLPLERARLDFQVHPRTVAAILGRTLLGLLVVILIWRGLKPLLVPLGELGHIVRYTLLGLWVAAGAPWLFVRAGLAMRGRA